MRGAVVTAFHAGVKKAFTEVFFYEIGLVMDQLEDIDWTAEGAHGRAHACLLIDSQGCPFVFVFYIALGDIGELLF